MNRTVFLTAQSTGAHLAGELTIPQGIEKPPVVLMLHGSGPHDRNENLPGQRLDVFNTLARTFAETGFASLRFDKRGCGESTGDYMSHGYADLVADARAWLDLLAGRDDVGSRYILGHSEGTLIGPLAARGRDDIAGLILLCPFIQDGEDILRKQAERGEEALADLRGIPGVIARAFARLFGGPSKTQDRLIARLRSTDSPVIRFLGRKLPARSLRDLLESEPRPVHEANHLPTLVLVAGKDVQCDPADGREIASLNPNAALVEEPDLTHILRIEPGPPTFATYPKQLKQPMSPLVGKHVSEWLTGVAPRTYAAG